MEEQPVSIFTGNSEIMGLKSLRMMDQLNEFVVLFNNRGSITYINRALCLFINRSRQELLDPNYDESVFSKDMLFNREDIEDLNIESPEKEVKKTYTLFSDRTRHIDWKIKVLENDNGEINEYLAIGTDNTLKTIYSDAITVLTSETSKVTGEIFFNTLIINIQKILHAEFVILAEFGDEKTCKIKSFATCYKGEIVDNLDLQLADRNFYNQISQEVIVVQESPLNERTSKELIIIDELLMSSYVSIPLLNKRNRPIGVLMVLSQRSHIINETYLELIKIFADRAAAEKERLAAEVTIKESENKYRILADYNYDWEYWIGKQGRYVYVSPSCYRITGYHARDFIKNPELLEKITLPEFRKTLEEQAPNALSADSFHNSIEIKIMDKSGQVRWIQRTCNLLYDDKGEYWGIRGNIRDITQKKEMEMALWSSERKFRNIFNNSQEGIVIVDTRNKILEVNRSFLELVRSTRKELRNQNLKTLIHPNDQQDYLEWSSKLARRGKIIELRIDTEFGTKSMEVSGTTIEYLTGKAVLTIFRDITERKNMQAKILNTIINTEEKERTRIAQDLHDGLGPLLSTIKLYANSILNARDDENKKFAIERTVETVDEAIINLKGISNNLSPHILRDFGLVVAVESFIKRFTDTHNLEIFLNSEITERFNPNFEVTLFRIIIELVNNTYKHANAKDVHIDIKRTGDILELSYKDDGCGFEYDDIARQPSGNGLFNIKNRIKSIGGDIWFNTRPGQGFKVHILISNIFSR